MSLRFFRIATWALVVALTVATGVVLWRGQSEPPTTGEVALGGPFTLTDVEGNRVDQQILADRPHAIFFGFTHCPDVCPTTLAELSVLVDDLGPDADKVDVYFVSVDPERDDPETLKSYLSSFSGKIHGLTGSEEEIADFVTSYRVYARKVPTDGGDYTMDHTASVFLFGADGRFRGTISYGESHDDALAKLRRLVEA
jgi:protein SCO1